MNRLTNLNKNNLRGGHVSNIGATAKSLVNRRKYEKTKAWEVFEYLFLALLGISMPLVFQHPQLLVGSAVNFVLIMAAINVKGWGKVSSLIVLPSVSAALGTYLFGPFQVFLLYMLPFIWIGNATIIFLFKYLYVERKMKFLATLPIAAVLKAGFLFAIALVLIKLSVIPAPAASVFATGMGLVQLVTALLGGCAAFAVNLAYKAGFAR